MALRGTLTHRKTRRLALALEIDPPEALGLMEALWNVAAELRPPNGAVGRLSDADLVMEMHSRREGSTVVAALVKAGLLDAVDGPDRLVVHDWSEHSDDTTDVKLGRMLARYADGKVPRLTRLSVVEREKIRARYAGGSLPGAEVESRHEGADLPAAADLFALEAHEGADLREKTVGLPGFEGGGESDATERHTMPLPEPEPEPEPNTKQVLPPTPGRAGGVRVRVVGRGLGQAAEPAEFAAVRAAVGAAVAKVRRECGLSEPRMAGVIERALRLECGRTDEAPDWNGAAERMVRAWEAYGRAQRAGLLRYAVRARRFFAEMWREEGLWGWDDEALRRKGAATVGMG